MRREALFASFYFVGYVGYLFLHPEGELLHWLTLVLLPLLGVFVVGRYSSMGDLLRSIGLDRSRLFGGIGWTVAFATLFQVLQVLNRRQRLEIAAILGEPLGFLLPLLAFVLLLLTVATTEEVFFRGILQSRFANQFQSKFVGLLLATVSFIIYHVPYAYLKPSWPSAGDFTEAIRLAVVNGFVAGVALGVVYWRSRNNLVAVMLLHAGIDLLPATRLVHRLIHPG